MVVLVFPRAPLADELPSGGEGPPPVEFLLVDAMTALDFPILEPRFLRVFRY
jgi:hypothetical protein